MKKYFCITPKSPLPQESFYVEAQGISLNACYLSVKEFCKNQNINLEEINIKPIVFMEIS